jgi:hypothetical protein
VKEPGSRSKGSPHTGHYACMRNRVANTRPCRHRGHCCVAMAARRLNPLERRRMGPPSDGAWPTAEGRRRTPPLGAGKDAFRPESPTATMTQAVFARVVGRSARVTGPHGIRGLPPGHSRSGTIGPRPPTAWSIREPSIRIWTHHSAKYTFPAHHGCDIPYDRLSMSAMMRCDAAACFRLSA